MRSSRFLLFIVMFGSLVLTSASAHAAPCDIFLLLDQRAEKKAVELKTAKDKLERLVEEQLVKAGFTVNDDVKTSWFIKRRIKNLASLIDPYQFQNPNYLKFWVEKLINLKISENLKPVDDKKLSRPEREALNRLILRQMILRGVADLEIEKQPSRREQFLKLLRKVRHTPFFRILVEWRLPRETVHLTDEMIANIAANGVQLVDKSDSGLSEVILRNGMRIEHKAVRIQEINALFVAVTSLYFMNYYYENVYPKIELAVEKAYEEQVQKNTEEFKQEVIEMIEATDVDTEEIKLALAKDEIEVIEREILSFNGTPVTADEKVEIREKICLAKYGNVLSDAAEKTCMGFE